MNPASRSRSAIRPASVLRSPRAAADDPSVVEVCEPVLYAPPAGAAFAPGVPERRGRDGGLRRHRARGRGRAARARSTRSRPRRSTRKRFGWPGCRGPGTPICSAHLTGASHVAMMFHSDALRVVLATVHIPLAEVPRALTRDVARGDDRADGARAAAIRRRRARASPSPGLNPHAGEHGLFGDEEEQRDRAGDRRVPRRAASTSRVRFPATPSSCAPSRGEFDVVVACYHDQGLIPVKLARVRPGGERDARPADRPHVGRSRHGVRHRRQGHRRSGQHDCGGAAGGALAIAQRPQSRARATDVASRLGLGLTSSP